MEHTKSQPLSLPDYRVRAKNTAAESENKIHDDEVAARYGFCGGLVPGVTVYGYMTAPIVERFGTEWLARGAMQVKFHKPSYEGEEIIVKSEVDNDAESVRIALRAEREDLEVSATAMATIDERTIESETICIEDYPEAPLPSIEDRASATREAFTPGAALGTLTERLMLPDTTFLDSMSERLPVYVGSEAVAHPAFLLGLANQLLARNFKLGPWIHAASEIVNHSVVRDGETVSVRGRIRECFERKGHQFVVVDSVIVTEEGRLVQKVRHTAIYRPRFV